MRVALRDLVGVGGADCIGCGEDDDVRAGWTQITPSQYVHEREALAFLCDALPDHTPWHAWGNFEFVVDGNVSEVDALVVGPHGVYLVEVKGWPGRIEGDAGTWRWLPPDGRPARSYDNPLLLADRKAKRLKGLLARQRALRGKRVPFIRPLVFLSDPELQVALDDSARGGVALRIARSSLPGVIDVLTRPRDPERPARVVDRPLAAALAAALEQAGIRPSQQRRRVGDLELGELIDEGVGYQDFGAVHPRFPKVQHRVRLYGMSDLAAADEREQVARAARREYELLAPIEHPGIISPQQFVEHDLGPALVFARDPDEQRLDHMLSEEAGTLNLFERIALLRDIGEAVAYAHSRRLFHRALSPRSVLVGPGVRVFNWQAGASIDGTTAATVAGTRDVDHLVDAAGTAYLAPEALTVPDADPELLDVFSLGAIAYHLFCDAPPAASRTDLLTTLERDAALEVSARLDGASALLADLVREATRADPTRRTPTVTELLADLEAVREELTRDSPRESVVAPEDAASGDLIGRYIVDRRLGRGSTAIALLVEDEYERQYVLKVANDPERNQRIHDEGEVLAKLRHPAIVAVHGESLELGSRLGIVLGYASEGTVARRLREDGRLSLENLQDWGDDLLSALAYLEQEGIPHRDIKPDNLGIAEVGASKKRRLMLLDFSLARAPVDRIEVGTRPYLDPFLGTTRRRRWDLAADRFSAAMVLHEMATGVLPYWGSRDAKADPRMVADEATIEADLLPREVAGPLGDLLARALRRDAHERFDTAEEMLRAWRDAFVGVEPAGTVEELDPAALQAATPETPVTALGLGARATDALDRLGVVTVADLLEVAPIEFNRLRGVGLATRRLLVTARRALHERLGTATTTTEDVPDVQALDALAGQIVPRLTPRNTSQAQGLRRLLGLEPIESEGKWPSQTEVAASMGVSRARIGQIVEQGRQRWRRLPAVTRLRDELVAAIEALGGVGTADELERIMAGQRGGGGPDGVHARAAVRAAVEVELAREAPRLGQRRSGSLVLLATAGEEPAVRQRVFEHALRLGARADELAAAGTLLPPAESQAALRGLHAPPALQSLSAERLVTLAGATSRTAAVSARLELHPRDLDPLRALRLGRSALLGADVLTLDEVQRRIAARFPAATPLPDRPRLDKLLAEAGTDLRWDPCDERYHVRERPALGDLTDFSSSLTRFATVTTTRLPPPTDPAVMLARDFDARLRAALAGGAFLVLTVPPRRLVAAERQLRTLPLVDLDLDREIIGALRNSAQAVRARWEVVLDADAAPSGSAHAQRLDALVQRAMAAVEERIGRQEGAVLLRHPGLLARYRQLTLVDRLRQRLLDGGPPTAVLLLVGSDQQADRPLVDGQAVPVLGDNELLRIPDAWLQNRHRGGRPERDAA
jgi:serine/threonine protein kinase